MTFFKPRSFKPRSVVVNGETLGCMADILTAYREDKPTHGHVRQNHVNVKSWMKKDQRFAACLELIPFKNNPNGLPFIRRENLTKIYKLIPWGARQGKSMEGWIAAFEKLYGGRPKQKRKVALLSGLVEPAEPVEKKQKSSSNEQEEASDSDDMECSSDLDSTSSDEPSVGESSSRSNREMAVTSPLPVKRRPVSPVEEKEAANNASVNSETRDRRQAFLEARQKAQALQKQAAEIEEYMEAAYNYARCMADSLIVERAEVVALKEREGKQAEVLTLTHREEIDTMRTEKQTALLSLRREHKTACDELEKKNQEAISVLERNNESQLKQLKSTITDLNKELLSTRKENRAFLLATEAHIARQAEEITLLGKTIETLTQKSNEVMDEMNEGVLKERKELESTKAALATAEGALAFEKLHTARLEESLSDLNTSHTKAVALNGELEAKLHKEKQEHDITKIEHNNFTLQIELLQQAHQESTNKLTQCLTAAQDGLDQLSKNLQINNEEKSRLQHELNELQSRANRVNQLAGQIQFFLKDTPH